MAKNTNFALQTFTDPARIRNFCIIAHIDHGKSTLADRILQLSNVVDEREMRDQYLDSMDIERERGITIKAQNVRLSWVPKTGAHAGEEMVLQMIDTPGHVDFSYEVSRSLDACEGAILLVDAAQGIEAQTLANLYMAMENDLEIIPVLNKIDLPAADPDKYAEEIAHIIGCEVDEVLRVSGKTGQGVPELLDRVVELIPAPSSPGASEGSVGADLPARALVFDSVYDTYRGVVTYIRMMDGKLESGQKVQMMNTGVTHEILEIGIVSPTMQKTKGLGPGEVGYLITGVKDVRETRAWAIRSRGRRRAQKKRSLASKKSSRWSIRACSRCLRRTSRRCVRAWKSCSLTTLPSLGSPKPPSPWASASAAASLACCTWRSPATAWSASSTWI